MHGGLVHTYMAVLFVQIYLCPSEIHLVFSYPILIAEFIQRDDLLDSSKGIGQPLWEKSKELKEKIMPKTLSVSSASP